MESVVEVRVCHGTMVQAMAAAHPEEEGLFVYTLDLYPGAEGSEKEEGLRGCEHTGKCTVVASVAPKELADFVLVLAGYTPRKEQASAVVATKVAGIWSHGEFVEPKHAPHPADPQFLKWPKTQHLNEVEKECRRLSQGPINVTYRAKVKLHGTNLAVHVLPDGRVFTQSRNRMLSGERDHFDFDAWVQRTAESWRALNPAAAQGTSAPLQATVVFGEWCGKGIHKGDAVCSLEPRAYCVFGVVLLKVHSEETAVPVDAEEGEAEASACRVDYHASPRLVVDPEEIKKHLQPVLERNPDVHVIPWHGEPFTLTLGGHEFAEEEATKAQQVQQAQEVVGGIAAEREPGAQATDAAEVTRVAVKGGEKEEYANAPTERKGEKEQQEEEGEEEKGQQEEEGEGEEEVAACERAAAKEKDAGCADPNAEALAWVNGAVEDISQRDPWAHATFNIEGPGEGVVANPLLVNGKPQRLLRDVARYMFKAKSERHRVKVQAKPAQVKTEVAASVAEFVNLAITPARCRQGEEEVGGRDRSKTSAFLRWIANDVQQECAAELEAAGLTWKDVKRPVSTTARKWWFS